VIAIDTEAIHRKVNRNRVKKAKSRQEKANSSFTRYFKSNYDLYLLLIPGLLFLLIFRFVPLTGNIIAFKELNLFGASNIYDSILQSPWVGWKHFERALETPGFISALRNTFIISIYKIVFLFPIPIVLAILINEMRHVFARRLVQTLIFFPHFLSWVIIASLFITLLNSEGIVNSILVSLGFEKMNFLTSNAHFRAILVMQEGWKESGWSIIIYLAAIVGINPQLYEAAIVDGASRFRQVLHITLPGLASTIVLMIILRLGWIMEAGFEQIFVMYNAVVYDSADILGTFVYRIGLGQLDYSFATAVGMFESVVGFVIIIAANFISRKVLGKSIW
jgi:putative aldouronate transport system permease protein